jgi:hypothetical protein
MGWEGMAGYSFCLETFDHETRARCYQIPRDQSGLETQKKRIPVKLDIEQSWIEKVQLGEKNGQTADTATAVARMMIGKREMDTSHPDRNETRPFLFFPFLIKG